jgi:MscS family membrane protein
MIRRLLYGLSLFIAILLSSHYITFPAGNVLAIYFSKFLDLLLITIFCGCSYLLLRLLEDSLRSHLRETYEDIDLSFPPVMGKISAGILVGVIAILCLKNFTKIDIGPVLASLGLGGLAIALAAKDTVSNLFGAVTVLFDKPFVIGDTISVAGYKGEVEEIRLRTTLIRTDQDTIVTIPNHKMIDSPIENISRNKPELNLKGE